MLEFVDFYRSTPHFGHSDEMIQDYAEAYTDKTTGYVDIDGVINSLGGSSTYSYEDIFKFPKKLGFPYALVANDSSFLVFTRFHDSLTRERMLKAQGLAGFLCSDHNDVPHVIMEKHPYFMDESKGFARKILLPELYFKVAYKALDGNVYNLAKRFGVFKSFVEDRIVELKLKE